MTTSLSVGNPDKWVLTSDVVYTGSRLFSPATQIISLGTNAQFSIIKDSQYFSRHYEYDSLGGPLPVSYVANVNDTNWFCSSIGHAYHFDIGPDDINNQCFMAVVITPNNSAATLVDGFGTYSKSTLSFTPSIGFGTDGASISITPSTHVTTAPNTHVQLPR
ncbi:MAG: hypothetical protein VB086_06015 [Clostridiaceae bacterium]|nr:hypothetical protein [Clostridiaceae bacterium]